MIDACRPCTCQQAIGGSGQQAKCGGKELTEVPSTLPNDTCRLTLRDNTITTIEAFRDLTKLEFLKLHDNPYHCDCELIGLVDFLKSGSVSVYENQCCFTPAKLNGTELVSLSAANLTCSEMTTMETNSSPLKVGDFLVTAQLFLYLLVKTLI
ncbi:platelet glycoprotein IX-like [Saccostrea cucullata]|uniref:platelet glycoprotein IX-like n=1 Tax=Saccostrea cuccullata TaxID=36930 RepID=UPI002ED4BA32